MREIDEDTIIRTLDEYATREIPDGWDLWAGVQSQVAPIAFNLQSQEQTASGPATQSPPSPSPDSYARRMVTARTPGAPTRIVGKARRRFSFSAVMAVAGLAVMLVMLTGMWAILRTRADVVTEYTGSATPVVLNGGTTPVDSLALVPNLQLLRSQVTGPMAVSLDGQSLLAWSPDGELLAESGSNVVVVREAVSGRLLFISPFADSGTAHALTWSPDGSMIAVGLDYDQVVVLDGATGKESYRLAAPKPGENQGAGATSPAPVEIVPPSPPIVSLSWSPDSAWLAAAPQFLFGNSTERRGEVRLWYIATGTLSRNLSLASLGPYTQVRSGPFAITRVAWSSDGRYLASISDRDVLAVWDPFGGSQVRSLQEGAFSRDVYRPLDFRWSPDGSTMAVLTQYSVELWDPHSGTMLRSLPEQPPALTPTNNAGVDGYGNLLGAVWSPRGDMIATFDGEDTAGTIRVWEVTTGRQLYSRRVETPGQEGMPLAWSPDGRVLAVAGATLELWDARSNTKLRDLDSTSPRGFMWSPDGSMLAVYAQGKLEIWGDPARVKATATATVTIQAP